MHLKITTYNVEHMSKIFHKENLSTKDQRLGTIATTIKKINPDLLGIVEASHKSQHHEELLDLLQTSDSKYKMAKSSLDRKNQDLVIYYKSPFILKELDSDHNFYDSWTKDIDADGILEVCQFERKPLEARFSIEGTDHEILFVLVCNKSKGVFRDIDLITYQHLALANRKKLLAQSQKIRERLDIFLDQDPHSNIVLMGDFNDEPGLDSYERMLGQGALDTITGSVYEPAKIFHNVLWHWMGTQNQKYLWTTQYTDKIVFNSNNHKAWLDHILISPAMCKDNAAIRYLPKSGTIERNPAANAASDHYPVSCSIEIAEI